MARAPVVQEIEPLPEADRLEDYPHPRLTGRLLGQASAQAEFAAAFAATRVHHAWLVSGREGIGKATFAYHLARFVLAMPDERGAGEDGALSVPAGSVANRQVAALSHPGLMLLRRTWEPKNKRFLSSIVVDDVRRLKGFLVHSAAAGAWRVVIVDQADELNANAANALLKSLEEPPPRVVFVLISSEPGRLLPTIRSRCRRLALAPLADVPLRQAAEQALGAAGRTPVAEDSWPRLVQLAHGSVRRLLQLAGSEGLPLHDKVTAILSQLPKVDWSLVHALADEVSGPGTEVRFEQLFEMLAERIAALVRARAIGQSSDADLSFASRLIPADGLATWAELWETTLARKAETMELNLDRKSLLLETVSHMQAAARG